jgi:hypothetical protein
MTLRNSAVRSSTQIYYFPFEGGLNVVDPVLSIQAGECIAAKNFEVDIRGRYSRVDGYERADGQTLPSEVTYFRIPFTTGSSKDTVFASSYSSAFHLNIPSSGDMVKGDTSGALGVILAVSVEDITGDGQAGFFPTNAAEGYIYFTATSGDFQEGETIYFLNKDSAFGSAFNVEYT